MRDQRQDFAYIVCWCPMHPKRQTLPLFKAGRRHNDGDNAKITLSLAPGSGSSVCMLTLWSQRHCTPTHNSRITTSHTSPPNTRRTKNSIKHLSPPLESQPASHHLGTRAQSPHSGLISQNSSLAISGMGVGEYTFLGAKVLFQNAPAHRMGEDHKHFMSYYFSHIICLSLHPHYTVLVIISL